MSETQRDRCELCNTVYILRTGDEIGICPRCQRDTLRDELEAANVRCETLRRVNSAGKKQVEELRDARTVLQARVRKALALLPDDGSGAEGALLGSTGEDRDALKEKPMSEKKDPGVLVQLSLSAREIVLNALLEHQESQVRKRTEVSNVGLPARVQRQVDTEIRAYATELHNTIKLFGEEP